jgi:hypothetical protein
MQTRTYLASIPAALVIGVAQSPILQSSAISFFEIDPRVSWTAFVPAWAMELQIVPLAVALIPLLRGSRE